MKLSYQRIDFRKLLTNWLCLVANEALKFIFYQSGLTQKFFKQSFWQFKKIYQVTKQWKVIGQLCFNNLQLF